MSISDDKFYAQKDANFRQRVYNILYNDSKPHSEQEALELIVNLSKRLEPIVVNFDNDYAQCVDTLVDNMKSTK